MTDLFQRLGGRDGLKTLITRFYERAQQDALLGPVFARQVHDWPSHIETVTDFWSTQTGGPALYRGGMGKHLMLGLAPEHFERWLELWNANAREQLSAECADSLLAIGRAFAARLMQMQAGAGIRIGTVRPASVSPPQGA
jgi:hemoglobin